MNDSPPKEVIAKIRQDMEQLSGIEKVSDIHCWEKDGAPALAARVTIKNIGHMKTLKTSLNAFLENRYGITHSILEFDTSEGMESLS